MGIVASNGPYLLVVGVLVIGVYILLAQRNLLKSLIGLYVFQTAVILFFIMLAHRYGADVPIVSEDEDSQRLMNPLPHAMMLTAIVVGVATLGVGLSLLRRIQDERGSIEES